MKSVVLIVAIFCVGGLWAEPIYKSVDKHGNVSYSSTPESKAVKVNKVIPPPPPRQQDVDAAKQRYRELEVRDRQRERERRELAIQQQKAEQQKADAELRRKLADQKPANIIVVNQNPYYWGRRYDRWRPGKPRRKHRPKATPLPSSKVGTSVVIPMGK